MVKWRKATMGHKWFPFQSRTFRLIYRFSQAKKRSSHFFLPARLKGTTPCPGQDQNPGRPTRSPVHWPLDYWTKPVVACLRYSWPCMLKLVPCTVVQSYIQIFSAWWVTTILYNYGASLCELRYKRDTCITYHMVSERFTEHNSISIWGVQHSSTSI